MDAFRNQVKHRLSEYGRGAYLTGTEKKDGKKTGKAGEVNKKGEETAERTEETEETKKTEEDSLELRGG